MTEPTDVVPDAELLADLVEAVEAGRTPTQAALEEASLLAEALAGVRALLRRRAAVRRMAELLRSGEYPSVRAAAPRVAAELGVGSETVREWWSLRLGFATNH